MAAPVKKTSDKKTVHSSVRLTIEQRDMIKSKALRVGYSSVSRYMRESALTNDDARLPSIRAEYIRELKKIGVNINQMQHHVNEVSKFGGKIDYLDIQKRLDDYQTLLKQAISMLYIKP